MERMLYNVAYACCRFKRLHRLLVRLSGRNGRLAKVVYNATFDYTFGGKEA